MIQLNQESPYYKSEFGRFKDAPTHAVIVSLRWSMPLETMNHGDQGFAQMLRPHVEAVYALGRLDAAGAFMQTSDDGRHVPIHSGVDMTDHETEPTIGTDGNVLDSPERTALKQQWSKHVAVRDTLLADYEGPHVDDPTQRVPSPCPKNRFSEFDLDIVFSHMDYRLAGKAV
jgi:hypothetical protein